MSVVWHDLECGPYAEDLELWRSLADEQDGAILDVGAGTGRVTLDLARHGHPVTALDRDPTLLAELERRARGLEVSTVLADARKFDVGRRFGLCLVPMQTIQLLPGTAGRRDFLRCAKRHLEEDARLAIAISESLEFYEVLDGMLGPLPDMCELAGIIYCSQPTAVRPDGDGFVIERRRETVTAAGERRVEHDAIHLDRVTASELEREASSVGLQPAARVEVPETSDHSGSSVVILRA